MIYVVSDIHGRYDRYKALLQVLDLTLEDTLYVLGDSIDRGPDGCKLLLDMVARPNVVALLGNHEDMAMDALPSICQTGRPSWLKRWRRDEREAVDLWLANGGESTLNDLRCLTSEQAQIVWEQLLAMPLYQEVTVGEQKFVLVHGGLANFAPERTLADYSPDEILWYRPEPNTVYYADKKVIFGHTPTNILYAQAGETIQTAKIFHRETFIGIDCGCGHEKGRLGCLCLDTLEEIYV